jgi:hypothetical protein
MASADLELCYMTATEALARFRARTLSPLELLDALIARSENINPQLNALTYTFYERARDQAKKAEAKYQSSDGRLSALEGIPVAIKDFHPVKGEITTFGSKIFENHRPDYTAPTVDRMLKAGAIMHQPHDHSRVRLFWCHAQPAVGHHAQSVESEIHVRWFVGRRRGGGGLGHDHHRRRHRRRRLDPHPCFSLRHRRLQGAVRPQSARPRSSA